MSKLEMAPSTILMRLEKKNIFLCTPFTSVILAKPFLRNMSVANEGQIMDWQPNPTPPPFKVRRGDCCNYHICSWYLITNWIRYTYIYIIICNQCLILWLYSYNKKHLFKWVLNSIKISIVTGKMIKLLLEKCYLKK